MQTSRPAHLWPILSVFCFFAFGISCNKDTALPQAVPALTIEEAKQFFASKTPANPTGVVSMRTDSTETGPSGPSVVPDWENAVSYFDEAKQQSVVEAPLLQSNLSRHLINPGNAVVDTAAFLHSPQNNRLVIVRDTEGVTDYAIMKISGTHQYDLSNGAFASNTYQQMDSLFEGRVSYVDINDRVRQAHYRYNGHFYDIDSVRLDGLSQNEVQEMGDYLHKGI